MIKTFRGHLADGDQEKIRLSTKKGKIGYRIVKFQIMIDNYTSNRGSFVQLYKVKQTTVSTGEPTINFEDGNLLGIAMQIYQAANLALSGQVNIFEQEVFNQDVYITHTERSGGGGCNYYLELEVIKLSDNEAQVSTLMDIRSS